MFVGVNMFLARSSEKNINSITIIITSECIQKRNQRYYSKILNSAGVASAFNLLYKGFPALSLKLETLEEHRKNWSKESLLSKF